MDIGADLRKARTDRKLSIDEISRATKISASLLRAIENDAFDSVPRGLFTRGYLRAFAREVGLDGEEIVRRYRTEFEQQPDVPAAAGERSQPVEPETVGRLRLAVDMDNEATESRHRELIQLSVILLLVTVYFVGWKRPKAGASDLKEISPIVAAPAVQPAAARAPTAAAEVAVATAGRTDAPRHELTLDIQPQADCWVEATVDGTRVVSRIMKTGDHESVSLTGDVRLRVGEPSAFAFSIAGRPGRAIGKPGQPTTIHINPENYKSFLETQR